MFVWVDPWIRTVWFAMLDAKKAIVTAWIIKQTQTNDLERLDEIFTFFDELFTKHSPVSLTIEKLFFTERNKQKAWLVFTMRYMIMMLAYRHNITIYEISPLELKKHITGNGRAEKQLVKQVVQRLFGLQDLPAYADAADALWLALIGAGKKTGG